MLESQNLWVCKPNDCNRGKGINLFNSLEQLKKLIIDYTQGVEIIHQKTENTEEPKLATSVIRTDIFLI
jgi:hypothetical protein